MVCNNDLRDYHLAHYGVKGMKWGKHLKAASDWWKCNVTGSGYKKDKQKAIDDARLAGKTLTSLVERRGQHRGKRNHDELAWTRAINGTHHRVHAALYNAQMAEYQRGKSLVGRGEKALKKAGSAVNTARKSAGKAISSGAKKLSKAASGALNRLVKGASKAKNKIFKKKPSSYSKRVQKANNDFIRSTDYYFKAKDAAKKGKLSKTKHYRLKSNTTRDSMWKSRMKIKKKHW